MPKLKLSDINIQVFEYLLQWHFDERAEGRKFFF